eukprot:SM016834S02991  [mRNA]  locus=s16834:92:124:+ [translate_table: standard]
MRSKAPLAQR